MPGDDAPVELRYLSLQCSQLTAEGTNGAMRRTPRYPPSMAAVSGRPPRRAGASTAGVGPLGRPHLRHALERPTWRYRGRLSTSTAKMAPPNRGSLKTAPTSLALSCS